MIGRERIRSVAGAGPGRPEWVTGGITGPEPVFSREITGENQPCAIPRNFALRCRIRSVWLAVADWPKAVLCAGDYTSKRAGGGSRQQPSSKCKSGK